MGDEYRSRPEIEGKRIDFSQFHPLDHGIIACKGYPGGRRTHLRYRWEFQKKDAIWAATMCKVGWHKPRQIWTRGGGHGPRTWTACIACGERLSAPQPD